jgi:hypothetical protein
MLLLGANLLASGTSWSVPSRTTRRRRSSSSLPAASSPHQPFGRKDYWRELYRNETDLFSWYAEWGDLEPFVREWIHPDDRILLPGVGTDPLLQDLYKAGFEHLWAFDYAPESIEYWQRNHRWKEGTVDLCTADARDLPYPPLSFDAVLDKGTLDAVYLAGSTPRERLQNLELAITEIDRVVVEKNAVFWSLSAICTDALLDSPTLQQSWDVCADGSLYTTTEGYTSNNLDGTLLVWKRKG